MGVGTISTKQSLLKVKPFSLACQQSLDVTSGLREVSRHTLMWRSHDFLPFEGDFVIVEPIAEGNKVQAEIVHILYPRQIKHLKGNGLWLVKCIIICHQHNLC